MAKSTRIFEICCIDKFRNTRIPFLIVFSFLLVNFVYGQKYTYQFAIQNISSRSAAKDITGLIRPVFNDEEEPFACFPAFDEAAGAFDFKSDVDISQAQLEDALYSESLLIIGFKRMDSEGDLAKSHHP